MAYPTQGSLSTDSSYKSFISISEIITTTYFEQHSDSEDIKNGVNSLRSDSYERDGGFISIEMLQHWGNSFRGQLC